MATASSVADDGNPAGCVFLQARCTILAVSKVWSVIVSGDSRVRVRVDESG